MNCDIKWLQKTIMIVAIMLLSSIFLSCAFAQSVSTLSGETALMSLMKTWRARRKKAQKTTAVVPDNTSPKTTSQIISSPLTKVPQLALTPVQATNGGEQQQVAVSGYDSQHVFPPASPFEKEAFQHVARQALPMTPTQIIQLKQMLAETQRASSVPANIPPKPVLTTQLVSLAPGSVPPVIRLQQGFITSIVFVDASGAPWPVVSCNLGNPKAFNLIQWTPGSNAIKIQAISMYTYGNIAVNLKGLATPVMLTLIPGGQVVDYRVDLRIPRIGPNSKSTLTTNTLPKGAQDVLLNVLDGIAPKGATTLKVIGGDGQVWAVNDKMYLRTRMTVLSPSWIAVMSSPDGTKAYEMMKSSDVLVSHYGKTINLRIEEQ